MDPRTRIKTILLIGKIKADPEYAKTIEVTDSSHFRDKQKDKK